MSRGIAILGGLAAIVGVICGLFIEQLAWYNGTTEWIGSLGGASTGNAVTTYIPSDLTITNNILALIAGILTILGGLLALFKTHGGGFLGGIFIVVGCLLFLKIINFYTNTGVFWQSDNVHVGFGWMISAAGGLFSLLGGSSEK